MRARESSFQNGLFFPSSTHLVLSLGQCAFLLLFWIISSLLITQQQQHLSDFVLFSLGCGPKTYIWFEIGCDLQSQDACGRGKFFQQNQCGPACWETSGKHHFYDTCLTFSAMFQCNTQQFSLKISWIIVWDQLKKVEYSNTREDLIFSFILLDLYVWSKEKRPSTWNYAGH